MNNVIQLPTAATSSLTTGAVNIAAVKDQVNLVQHVMRHVMVSGEHYGTIPGCGNKPALFKPGAEKLMLTFQLSNELSITTTDLPGFHREYTVEAKIFSNGRYLGAGIGSCSTMESKYRFRGGEVELTETPVPKAYWDLKKTDPKQAQELIGGKGFVTKKNDQNQWVIGKLGEKVEYDNPADYYNTCLKMAKKRALVDAILTVTAASDIFTQDIEEDPSLFSRSAVVASPPQPQVQTQTETQVISLEQVKQLQQLIKDVHADEARFCQFLQIETLASLPADRFEFAVTALDRKRTAPASQTPDTPAPAVATETIDTEPHSKSQIIGILAARKIEHIVLEQGISAKSFQQKDFLKSLGFKFHDASKCWLWHDYSYSQAA